MAITNFSVGEPLDMARLNELVAGINSNSVPTYWQRKEWSGGQSLDFSGLTIGKTYRMTVTGSSNTGGNHLNFSAYCGSKTIGVYLNDPTGVTMGNSFIFVATATTITMGSTIMDGAFLTLEELPNHEEKVFGV